GRTRLVVGRDEGENNQLERLAQAGDYLFSPQKDLLGPTALARGLINQELISLSSQITFAYTDEPGLEKAKVLYRQFPLIKDNLQQISRLPKEKFAHLFI
ncbi:MAG: hypothetical protein ABIH91_02530, partial [Candidatus Omnitrophota bacterium]